MNDWKLPWEGGCRCGRVRIRLTEPPLIATACHCTGCQRMTASAFSLTLTFTSPALRVIAGEPVLGGLHGPTRHYHCAHCKSWIFTRPEGMDDYVNVRAPMLDESRWISPFVEVWTREKFPWANTSATYSYETVPPIEEYGKLIQEYAQGGLRSH
jgi:hypothetical protein